MRACKPAYRSPQGHFFSTKFPFNCIYIRLLIRECGAGKQAWDQCKGDACDYNTHVNISLLISDEIAKPGTFKRFLHPYFLDYRF